MVTADVHVRATDRALHDRPETFDALNMMNAVDPFVGRMVDRAMRVAVPRQLGVGLQFIRADGRAFLDVGKDVRLQRRAANILDNVRHHIAIAFQHAEHGRLAGSAAPALSTAALAADHRFIGFHVAGQRRVAVDKTEILSNFVTHAPSCFVIHAQLTLQFLCRNSVARCREQIERIKPLLQRRVRAMKWRADHRVNVLAALARVGRYFRQLAKLADLAATRTCEISAVARLEQMLQARIVIGEHLHELLDRKWLGHDALRHLKAT